MWKMPKSLFKWLDNTPLGRLWGVIRHQMTHTRDKLKGVKSFISIGWFSNLLAYHLLKEGMASMLQVDVAMDNGALDHISIRVPGSNLCIAHPPPNPGPPQPRAPELVMLAFLTFQRPAIAPPAPQQGTVSIVLFGGFRGAGTHLMAKYLCDEEAQRDPILAR
jgi:hypothetical protein